MYKEDKLCSHCFPDDRELLFKRWFFRSNSIRRRLHQRVPSLSREKDETTVIRNVNGSAPPSTYSIKHLVDVDSSKFYVMGG